MEDIIEWYSSIEIIENNMEHICHSLASNKLKLDNIRQICDIVYKQWEIDHTTPINSCIKQNNKRPPIFKRPPPIFKKFKRCFTL